MNTISEIPFFKMQGSGNDFILIDNRTLCLPVEAMPDLARTMCPRAFSVGADGLILLDQTPPDVRANYIWHFYNADGSRAEMCGNGSRCAALLAHRLGMAPAIHTLGTDAGPVRTEVFPDQNQVRVQLTPVSGLETGLNLQAEGLEGTVHFAVVGVPHAVIIVQDVADVDIRSLGRIIRGHKHFAPKGTNVNFIQVIDRRTVKLRTYERGVEDETFACGTGAAASVAVARALDLVEDEVRVTPSGGEDLIILLQGEQAFLKGSAVLVFEGRFFSPRRG
ncbi:MAG: diaminopimelate epimerase [Deltaproteobacteria bacterium]|nr:diaminopimelate epimerase [Deltaproteobacteria bacterium]